MRQTLDKYLSVKNRRNKLIYASSIITLASSCLYVMYTYYSSLAILMELTDYVASLFFTFELAISFILSQHRIGFIFSKTFIMMFLIIVPPLFSSLGRDDEESYLMDFINTTRILRFFKLYKGINSVTSEKNDIKKQIVVIVTTILMIVFIFSGILQIVEKYDVIERIKEETDTYKKFKLENRTEFHHYVYFIVVTISTVGFGEIYPFSNLGKALIGIVVFVTLILIPKQTNDLVQILDSETPYARNRYKSSNDVDK